MEEVQKNENGTTVPQADGKPKKEDKTKGEHTPQQVQAKGLRAGGDKPQTAGQDTILAGLRFHNGR